MTDMEWFIVGFASGVPTGAFLFWYVYLRGHGRRRPR